VPPAPSVILDTFCSYTRRVMPLSTWMIAPVVKLDAAPARCSGSAATSTGHGPTCHIRRRCEGSFSAAENRILRDKQPRRTELEMAIAMTPTWHAEQTPDAPAIVMSSSGETSTFAELEDRSVRLARGLQERGVVAGDHIAILMENNRKYLEVAWAAQRSGLHYTAINRHLRRPRCSTYWTTAARWLSSRRSRRHRWWRASTCPACAYASPPMWTVTTATSALARGFPRSGRCTQRVRRWKASSRQIAPGARPEA